MTRIPGAGRTTQAGRQLRSGPSQNLNLSGQVYYSPKSDSEAMRVTRQLGLPPR